MWPNAPVNGRVRLGRVEWSTYTPEHPEQLITWLCLPGRQRDVHSHSETADCWRDRHAQLQPGCNRTGDVPSRCPRAIAVDSQRRFVELCPATTLASAAQRDHERADRMATARALHDWSIAGQNQHPVASAVPAYVGSATPSGQYG